MTTKRTTVTAIDDQLILYEVRDLSSRVIANVVEGGKIQLGTLEEFDQREWFNATLEDGTVGYALAPTVRGHTTFTETLLPASSAPNPMRTVPLKPRYGGANAPLWNCSSCGSPAAKELEASRRYFSGVVCNGCGRVLCGKCGEGLARSICQCGDLFVSTPLDLNKKPLDQTAVGARAAGEMPQWLRVARGFLVLGNRS